MTIAIVLKIGDAVVLGADSASTLMVTPTVTQVYFNTEKIINLHKGLPIGAATYGLGNIDQRSITSLAKELRQRFMGEDPEWALDPKTYTVQEVAERMKRFFYDEYYLKEYPQKVKDDAGNDVDQFAEMGLIVAGYSAGKREGEVYTVEVHSTGACLVTDIIPLGQYGAHARGQPEAFMRVMQGWSPKILAGLIRSGVGEAEALAFLQSQEAEPLVFVSMPVQDGLDLVRYLAEVTEGFVRFTPGASTVHGPIDLAGITYYEGFRWVQRKHYYPEGLNPAFIRPD